MNVTGDRKLVPRFVGPFQITERIGPLAYHLDLGTRYHRVHPVFHVSLLKPFRAGGDGYPHPTAAYVEDEVEWEVSGILRHKGRGQGRRYLVTYTGYDESEACWLSEDDLVHAQDILKKYKSAHRL